MRKVKKIFFLTVIISLFMVPLMLIRANANTLVYADYVVDWDRGTVTGDFPGWYGGSLSTFPIPLTDAEAEAAILGPPDTKFLSLPGNPNDEGIGPPNVSAWVIVGFNTPIMNMAGPDLFITELGANNESADIWVWDPSGEEYYVGKFTRNGSDILAIDYALSGYTGLVTMVAIVGLDELGGSKGFDLDAVGGTPVPIPTTILLLGSGFISLIGFRKKLI